MYRGSQEGFGSLDAPTLPRRARRQDLPLALELPDHVELREDVAAESDKGRAASEARDEE
jgi:hypothetical protein